MLSSCIKYFVNSQFCIFYSVAGSVVEDQHSVAEDHQSVAEDHHSVAEDNPSVADSVAEDDHSMAEDHHSVADSVAEDQHSVADSVAEDQHSVAGSVDNGLSITAVYKLQPRGCSYGAAFEDWIRMAKVQTIQYKTIYNNCLIWRSVYYYFFWCN